MFENIEDCIHARLMGAATEEQERALDEWMESNREEYDAIAAAWHAVEWGARMGTIDRERGWEGIATKRRVRGRRRRIRRAGVAAAAAVALLHFISYHHVHMHDAHMHAYALGNALIRPGVKKIRLMLPGGERIDVSEDSMRIGRNGMLISYRDGVLTYSAPGERGESAEAAATGQAEYNELWVPRGGECLVRLSDGTGVWMNSESYLKYPVRFAGERRDVYVEGEAFFDVASDGKPFIVSTSLGEIAVLGTAFGVRAYPSETVYVTLTRGKVRFAAADDSVVELEPGEQAVASPSGGLGKRRVDTAQYVGWKDGMYVFKDRSLGNIMKQLARWYDVTVIYTDPELENLRFTGNLVRYDNINGFMDLLAGAGELKYGIEGRNITIYR